MPAATETNEATVKRNAKAAANSAKAAAESAVDAGERSFQEAVDAAERSLTDAARRAEKVIREGVDALRSQSGPYADRARDYAGTAAQDFEDVQRFVVERVKEKPVTAALAGLGVSVLIGLLLSGRK